MPQSKFTTRIVLRKDTYERHSPIMKAIVAARIEQQMSFKAMSIKTGWTFSAIHQWETHQRRIPFAYVIAACQVLGLTLTITQLTGANNETNNTTRDANP